MKLCLPPAINKNKMQKYFTSHFVDSKVNLQVHNKKVILDQKWTFETCFMNDFWKETTWMGPKVILGLSDTLSDLNKLNHGEYSKYQLCSSKTDMTHVYMLFFKDKSI